MGWLQERVTHHGDRGQFCSPGNAVTVTKDGERYKVVRQHRRMKPKAPPRTTLETVAVAKEKAAAALARSSMRGFVNMSDLIEGAKGARR